MRPCLERIRDQALRSEGIPMKYLDYIVVLGAAGGFVAGGVCFIFY